MRLDKKRSTKRSQRCSEKGWSERRQAESTEGTGREEKVENTVEKKGQKKGSEREGARRRERMGAKGRAGSPKIMLLCNAILLSDE